MNVQYGCGLSAPKGWENFDSSLTLRMQKIPVLGGLISRPPFPPFPRNIRFGNIVEGLPVKSDSVDLVYCSHVLEHLALADLETALSNTFKMLKQGGIFRLVLPDLEYYIREYQQSTERTRAHQFMQKTGLGTTHRSAGLNGFLRVWLGGSRHLWMWDYAALSEELRVVGFREIRRAEIGDSTVSAFDEVEDKSRWDHCLGIHCVK